MGHILSKQGISPVKSKFEAIQQAPRPADVSQLRSFLAMLNYYSKFIPDFSSKLHPLYELLSNKTKWFWSESCEAAFLWAKEVLSSDQVLVHYDPSKPLIYADTLYGNEFGSSVWCRTSLLRMIWYTTSNQLVNWHFLATYSVAVLIDTQMKVNC